jgi:GNAT superfamily N-acetyltransferase
MNQQISIREASRDDSAEIAAVIQAAWQIVMRQFGWTQSQLPGSPAYCQPGWITAGMDKGVRFFIAKVGTQAAGCVGMAAPKDNASELVRLAVVPEYKRKGLGAMLVRHIIGQARSIGLARVDLALIAERTDLQKWYEKLGFSLTRIECPANLPFKVAYMAFALSNRP